MLTLILDTSTDYTLLALAKESQLLAEYPLSVGRASMTLLPSIQGFLRCHSYTLQDLTSIAVGTGPGAFTGTRIGVTIAKTLSYALNIPILPFCSLQAFKPLTSGPFYSVIDAKSGSIYALKGPDYQKPELILLEDLKNISDPILSPHAPDLQARLGAKSLTWHAVQPNAAHIASQLPTLIPTNNLQVTYLRNP